MAKKVVKKTKIKIMRLLIVLLVLIGLVFCVKVIINIPIKNIVIKGTDYLNDDYIIDIAKIKDYPSFILTQKIPIKKDLESSKYIDNVKISKKWGNILEIKIKENKALFYNTSNHKYILENSEEVEEEEISKNFRVPRLLNYVPDNKYDKFINGMKNIKDDTLSKISDIEYQPNEYDKDRFLLYMDDGNMVYLTLTKFKLINHYNEVLTQLEGHKGILYLDSGNHFQIKE